MSKYFRIEGYVEIPAEWRIKAESEEDALYKIQYESDMANVSDCMSLGSAVYPALDTLSVVECKEEED